jgi:hypothetical protein
MTNPAEVLQLPKPAWVSEDVPMLYDMAVKFLEAEIAPHYDATRRTRSSSARLGEGRRQRPALRLHAGGVWRLGRHLRA